MRAGQARNEVRVDIFQVFVDMFFYGERPKQAHDSF